MLLFQYLKNIRTLINHNSFFHMKYFTLRHSLLLLAAFLMPAITFAQEQQLSFVNSISLWIAIIIGLIASFTTLRNAHKIGASALGRVYTWFGWGMFLVVLGFLAVVVPPWADPFTIMRTHDLLFILGFGFMASGASRLLLAAGLK